MSTCARMELWTSNTGPDVENSVHPRLLTKGCRFRPAWAEPSLVMPDDRPCNQKRTLHKNKNVQPAHEASSATACDDEVKSEQVQKKCLANLSIRVCSGGVLSSHQDLN